MHRTQPVEIFRNVFTPFCTLAFADIHAKLYRDIDPRKLLRQGPNARAVAKYSDAGHVEGLGNEVCFPDSRISSNVTLPVMHLCCQKYSHLICLPTSFLQTGRYICLLANIGLCLFILFIFTILSDKRCDFIATSILLQSPVIVMICCLSVVCNGSVLL